MPQPMTPPAGLPERRHRSGLLIVAVLAGLVLLCAGGATSAYLLIQQDQPRGSAEPRGAIDGFLTAVFVSHSAADAASFVCPASRDDRELSRLVAEVGAFQDKYESPHTTWNYDPPVGPQPKPAVTVTVTVSTSGQQVASKQFRLVLLNDRGWWVCDAEAAP
jgi:hypothetical protein